MSDHTRFEELVLPHLDAGYIWRAGWRATGMTPRT